MADLVQIEKKENYLYCVAEHFPFSAENILMFAQVILKAYMDTDKRLIFVDFTAITENTPATLRVIAGIEIEELLQVFHGDVDSIPRVAAFCAPSHMSSYKPAQGLFEAAGLPIAMFTDQDIAREWLFIEKSA